MSRLAAVVRALKIPRARRLEVWTNDDAAGVDEWTCPDAPGLVLTEAEINTRDVEHVILVCYVDADTTPAGKGDP